MVVKKIQPVELSANLVFRLKNLYHAKRDEFIAMVDNKREILFVNKKVPQEDIDGFSIYLLQKRFIIIGNRDFTVYLFFN